MTVTDENPDRSGARILGMLAEPASLHTDGAVTVTPTASAGIAVYDGTYGDFDRMLDHADVALYHAKQQRGTHGTYQPQMRMPRNASRYGPCLRNQHPADSNGPLGGEVIP